MTEVFMLQDDLMRPGPGWGWAINTARHRDLIDTATHPIGTRPAIARLGTLLSGAMSRHEDVSLDLQSFVTEAVPPMNTTEAKAFRAGYVQGSMSLGNPTAEYITTEGVQS